MPQILNIRAWKIQTVDSVKKTYNIPDPKHQTLTLRLKVAQKPYIVWFLDPKALETLEPKGYYVSEPVRNHEMSNGDQVLNM